MTVPGELAAEEEERDVRADDRDGLDDAVDDAQAVAGEQVIGEGVAGEAGGHARG